MATTATPAPFTAIAVLDFVDCETPDCKGMADTATGGDMNPFGESFFCEECIDSQVDGFLIN
jgi:hypothetical protein